MLIARSTCSEHSVSGSNSVLRSLWNQIRELQRKRTRFGLVTFKTGCGQPSTKGEACDRRVLKRAHGHGGQSGVIGGDALRKTTLGTWEIRIGGDDPTEHPNA